MLTRLAIRQRPLEFLPKLFGEIRARYELRPGGYTRVLRIEPHKEDQAPSAILELVDGPRDMRFAMTAKTLARQRGSSRGPTELTLKNARKVTRFRPGGEEELERRVEEMEALEPPDEERRRRGERKERTYPAKRMDPEKMKGSVRW